MAFMKNRKLKNYFIIPSFQFKFISILVGTNLFIAFALLGATYMFFKESPTLFGLFQFMQNANGIHFREELEKFLLLMLVSSVSFIILIGILAVVLSHRSAGPLYRFKKVFEAIEQGDLSKRIHIRPNDDFQDVAQSFNKMMDSVTRQK